jgi:hypothetical protein
LSVLQPDDDQGTQHTDTDEGENAEDTKEKRGSKPVFPRHDQLHELGDEPWHAQPFSLDNALGYRLDRSVA